ncbi:MAG: 4'-phosphopantetheinyl transferase superfamily protein [Gammaproteobacteria bacterium]
MSDQSWQPASQQPPPAPGEIHVWRIDLVASSASPADVPLLSPDERERAGRLLCGHKRDRFIAGRSALRSLLGRYLDEAPQALEFRYGPHGKPALVTGASEAILTFNFSHSEDLALLAVATGREVGIDIEYRHRDISIAPFARHILCENETTALQRLPAERHKQALLTAWTRKEAYVKALGEGLARSLKSFSAGIADEETAVLRLEDASGEPRTWTFTSLAVHPDYLACLTAPGSDWTPRCFDWRPVL